MVRAINAIEAAPVSGSPIELLVMTGDAIDNAQANEFATYTALFEGGMVNPASGGIEIESVQSPGWPDGIFWKPDGGGFCPDHFRVAYGFPLVPGLLELDAGRFYLELASEPDRPAVLETIRAHLRRGQQIFVGVTAPIDPTIETPEEVRDRVLEAAEYIPLDQLGTTDDCGFAPFSDDTSTARATAFAKIRARVEGTQLAAAQLG